MKVIPNPNSVRLASNRIIKNIESKDKKEVWKKKTNKKFAECLKKTVF